MTGPTWFPQADAEEGLIRLLARALARLDGPVSPWCPHHDDTVVGLWVADRTGVALCGDHAARFVTLGGKVWPVEAARNDESRTSSEGRAALTDASPPRENRPSRYPSTPTTTAEVHPCRSL